MPLGDIDRFLLLNRKGTIFSEGAGALVLENLDQARARGATVLALLLGGAVNNNAHHMTAPAKAGAGSAAVMQKALEDAGLPPDAIDHVNMHGTGARPNDVTETAAVKTVFGADTAIPVTAIKAGTGHMMGAAGAVEAIATVLSLRDGVIPPTLHLETPDPDCDLDAVFHEERAVAMTTALSNSAGIGGCNAAVIIRKGDA